MINVCYFKKQHLLGPGRLEVIIARKRSSGKLMFLNLSVILFIGGGGGLR